MTLLSNATLNHRTAQRAQRRPSRRKTRPAAPHTTRLLFVLLVVMLGARATFANMTLQRYEMSVHQAVIELSSLEQWAKVDSPNQHLARMAETLKTVREAVPEEETIEWEGGNVRVNNSWLRMELDTLEKMSERDPRRAHLLAQIIERLRAIEEHLTEIRGQRTVAGASKEQEKARLDSIMRRAEFLQKPPEKNFLDRVWERFKEWLNNLFPSGGVSIFGGMSWGAFIAMIFIFTIAGAVLAYAITKLVKYLQRRTLLNLEPRQPRIILGERLTAEQNAASLLDEAEALARRGELRAAIRKGYIALLCELGDRKIITLAQHKTNRDYLRAVREKRERNLLDEMQKLTNSFENHWYGFQPTTPDDWTTFRSGYEKVKSEK